jgi:hypothetical protein
MVTQVKPQTLLMERNHAAGNGALLTPYLTPTQKPTHGGLLISVQRNMSPLLPLPTELIVAPTDLPTTKLESEMMPTCSTTHHAQADTTERVTLSAT